MFSDISELPWYYPSLGYSEDVFEGSMFHTLVTNQDVPLVSYQKVLGLPQLGHVIPCELVSYSIVLHPLQYGGGLLWAIFRS